jgi:hypothetical protein
MQSYVLVEEAMEEALVTIPSEEAYRREGTA